MRLSVVVPAYNEQENIVPFLNGLKAHLARIEPDHEIIIVNDGSSDRTGTLMETISGIRGIHHTKNRGYGAALKTGIKNALGRLVLTIDSDGQHHPQEVGRLLAEADRYDMVVGERTQLLHSSLWRMPGKWFLGWLANYLSRQKIPDLNSGLRIFKRELILKYLHLCPDGFSISTTSTLVFFNRGYSVKYVPITVNKRLDGKSTVSVKTGLETILLILRIIMLFEPLRLFLPLSIICAMLGVSWGIRYLLIGQGLSIGALLLILTGIVLFFFGLLADQIAALRKERYE